MIYVTSDLHGCSRERFLKMLERIGFGEQDELFVLGDVIDRNGDGGIGLLSWITGQPNVWMILGNHEAMMLSCDFLFREVTEENADSLTYEQISLYLNWIRNGGQPTIESLKKLMKEDRESFDGLWTYLAELPLYQILKVEDRVFFMTHSGLDHFSPDREADDYSDDDLLWNRPQLTDHYYDGITVLMGHTPTGYLAPDCDGKMIRTRTWIDIDIGAADGRPPMFLRLNDMKEFYFSEEELK